LTDEKQIVLEPFVPTPPPTVAQLNDLLGQMASQNQSAYDNTTARQHDRKNIFRVIV